MQPQSVAGGWWQFAKAGENHLKERVGIGKATNPYLEFLRCAHSQNRFCGDGAIIRPALRRREPPFMRSVVQMLTGSWPMSAEQLQKCIRQIRTEPVKSQVAADIIDISPIALVEQAKLQSGIPRGL